MKFLQLKYFYTACQFNNITQAAKVLHISQPAITNAIKDLENEFGVTLLHRTNRGFKLTKDGEFFFTQATELIKYLEQVEEMMLDHGQKRKLIRLGVPPMISASIFPKIYQSFKQLYPDIKIVTTEEGSTELLNALDKDLLDIVILVTNQVSEEQYNILNFTQTETVFCVNHSHPLAKKHEVHVFDFQHEPIITFKGGFYHNKLIYKLFSENDIEPNIIHRSTQLHTIIQFIHHQLACGFLFRDLITPYQHIRGISLKEPLQVDIGLVYRREGKVFTDMMKFIEFIRQINFPTLK